MVMLGRGKVVEERLLMKQRCIPNLCGIMDALPCLDRSSRVPALVDRSKRDAEVSNNLRAGIQLATYGTKARDVDDGIGVASFNSHC